MDRLETNEGPWTITRNTRRGYWIAVTHTPFGGGIPLDVAVELHNKPYHPEGDDVDYGTYGKCVRVAGHAGGPSPLEYGAYPDREGLDRIINEKGDGLSLSEISDHAKEMDIPLFVPKYHIDSSEGLQEFLRVVRSLE